MANAGRILIIPRGDYNEEYKYEMLDLVGYGAATWLAKKTSIGIEPSEANTEYWFKFLGHSVANNLTTSKAGYVLDARQGKVLMDAISSTNNRFSDVEANLFRLEDIVNGRNQAIVFDTTAEMNEWLADEANKGTITVGSNLYIVELDVPDWWISEVLEEADPDTGMYYKIAQLETQKVDLTPINEQLGGYTLKVVAESVYDAMGEGRPANTLYFKTEG